MPSLIGCSKACAQPDVKILAKAANSIFKRIQEADRGERRAQRKKMKETEFCE